MRVPFSFFLMPVFLFAWASSGTVSWIQTVEVFFCLHLFAYPASNGYNSWFDKDEGSIGGLEHPPAINPRLWTLVMSFDFISLAWGCFIDIRFGIALLGYLLVSKAYSWDKTRIKKYPFLSLWTVVVFQGAYTFFMTQLGLGHSWENIFSIQNSLLAGLSSLFLAASYPLTQIYQHQEDRERGDRTLSLILGIRGTFLWAGLAFFLALIWLALYSHMYADVYFLTVFLICTTPTLAYFSYWGLLVWKNPQSANFKHTMRLNMISSLCLSLCFVVWYWLKTF